MTTNSNVPWWRDAAIESSLGVTAAGPAERDRSATLSFWALMGFTFVLLLAPQAWIPSLAPLRIAMLSAALALLAYGYNRISRRLPLLEFSPPVNLVLLIIAWAIVTVPFSYWPGGSVAFVVGNFSKTVVVFVLLIHVLDNLLKLQRIVWGLVLMAVPLASTTIANYLSGVQMESGNRVAGSAAGLTSNPNDMALMLNLILPLCIALWLDATRMKTRILLGVVAGLIVFAIVATFSRAGFLTLAATGLAFAWRLRARPQAAWVPAVLVLVLLALPFSLGGYFDRINTIVNIEQDDSGSAQARLSDMKVALKLGLTHPVVGAGIGMNALAMNEARAATWLEVHNVYLQYLVELGVPGLVLFLLLYNRCLRATSGVLVACERHRNRGSLFHLTEGLRVSLIAFGVAALFHPVAYHFYFYYIAGLALAAQRIFREQEQGNGR